MSVEGMWAIYFGDVDAPGASPNSGVIVLETGKLFGGDSLIAYLGSYKVEADKLIASAMTWSYNPAHEGVTNAFGWTGKFNIMVNFEGLSQSPMLITGKVWEGNDRLSELPAYMHRIAELP